MSFALSRVWFNQGVGGMFHVGMQRALRRNASPLFSPSSFGIPRGNSSRLLSGRVREEPASVFNETAFRTSFASKDLLPSGTFMRMIDRRNNDGDTALHLAVKIDAHDSHYEICKLLLEAGADPNISDENNKTPLDTAEMNGNQGVIKLLSSYGALRSKS